MFDAILRLHAQGSEIADPQHRLFLECAWTALETYGLQSVEKRVNWRLRWEQFEQLLAEQFVTNRDLLSRFRNYWHW